MKTKLRYVISLMMFLLCFSVFAQKSSWKQKTNNNSSEGISKFHLESDKVQYFELNTTAFKQSLIGAPLRDQATRSNTQIVVPGAKGVLETFVIYEAPVFSETLAARYPNIKSYIGFSLDNQGARIRMSVSPKGVQTMITYLDKEAVFVMPASHSSNNYMLYNKSSRGNYVDEFECTTIDTLTEEFDPTMSRDADDQLLRTYRLAVSVTGEYTSYHGGTVADALAAINATITRVNEVFETDMAITFEIISNTDDVIYTNAATDPYSPASQGLGPHPVYGGAPWFAGNWNVELQETLRDFIGGSNYDIGHLFGASGGGGNAGCIGCVCETGFPLGKGSGITSPADGIPEGDNFDIDYVAHEIGHQMGANHTFAFNTEGTGVNAEPGSGTTIMGYAGITGANNVQQHSDPYFHYHSINQISNNVATSPNNCATTTNISNNPPVANAGSDYSIPKGTAYVLKGEATDADSADNLTYCWEQTDSGQVTNTSFGPTLASGSMNRSLSPTASPDRYIPNIDRVVNNQLIQTNPTINTAWETVSNVARDLNWALTVRDREPTATGLGGQSSFDLMTISVENVDPFTVDAPDGGEIWTVGNTQTVTWNVGQTTNATINCQTVNIKLSTDGGFTYPYTLASGTPNDGTETITVPAGTLSATARVMVEAADNIFYDISNDNFNINTNDPDFYFVSANGDQGVCGSTSTSFEFDYFAINGFTNTTNFTATGNPAGSNVVITPSSLDSSGSFIVDVNNLGGVTAGSYTITVTGTSGTIIKDVDVVLTIVDGICVSVANTQFETSTTLVQFNTIDNASGKPSGYSDYTSISTDVNRDSAYDLTVNMNTDGNFTCNSTVWIDWNQDCIFDASETYELGSATNTADGPAENAPLSVVVPADAVLGMTTMRVTTKWNVPATACENGHDAEVEDYTINVLTSLSVDDYNVKNFVVFPNPNNGKFTVKLNAQNDVAISVFDIRGRQVFDNAYKGTQDFNQTINLGSVQSGMYLVKVRVGTNETVRKIIVE